MSLSPEEIARLAERRVARKIGWYIHACVFVVINAYWLLSWHYFDGAGRRPWSLAPTLGWGLGLFFHFISVFVVGKGSTLRESMVQRERDRIAREQNRP